MGMISKAVSAVLVFTLTFSISLTTAHAAGSIVIGTSVGGEFSFGASHDEYSLRLDSPTDVGFNMNAWSMRGPEVFEFDVSIRDANGNGYSVGSSEVDEVNQPYKGEMVWVKNPVTLPAGNYTVGVTAYEYIFGDETPDGLEPNDLVVTYTLMLTGGGTPAEIIDMPGQETPAETSYGGDPVLVMDLNNNTYKSSLKEGALSPGMPAPFVDNSGNTLVPVAFLEEMGVTGPVWYDEGTRTVQIDMLDKSIYVQIGSTQFKIDDGTVTEGTLIDSAGNPVSPQIINGRTYLPLRAILAQCLGLDKIEYSGGVVTVYN